ncbi:MAG: diphthine synthase [Methanomicrobiales archaeon]
MLYFIGLGLFDAKDISLKGIEVLKNVDKIFAEFYTAKLFGSTLNSLEKIIDKKIIVLNRQEVEESNVLIDNASKEDVAFLTAGDPLIATTHSDMVIQAKKIGIDTQIIHASSILSAAPGIAGLQAYKFGKVTTIPFPEENYFPHSPYMTIKTNMEFNAHSLVLLDIRADEERYMTANQGLEYLLKVEIERKEKIIFDESLAVVIARAGSTKPLVRSDKIGNLLKEDFGGPLHSLIIPSTLHIMEAEYLVEIAGAPEDILKDSI